MTQKQAARRYMRSGLVEAAQSHGLALTLSKLDDFIKKGLLRNEPPGGWSEEDCRHLLLLLEHEECSSLRVTADRHCEWVVWKWLYWGNGWNIVSLKQVQRAWFTWLDAQCSARLVQRKQTALAVAKDLRGKHGTHVRTLAALLFALERGKAMWIAPACDMTQEERNEPRENRIHPVNAEELFQVLGWVCYGHQSQRALKVAASDKELRDLASYLVRCFQWMYQLRLQQVRLLPPAIWEHARILNLRLLAQEPQQASSDPAFLHPVPVTLAALRADACERLFLALTCLSSAAAEAPVPELIRRPEPVDQPERLCYIIHDCQASQCIELPFV